MDLQKDNQLSSKRFFLEDKKNQLAVSSGIVAGGIVLASSQPAKADTIADISALVTSLSTITGAAAGVIVLAMGVRIAVKQVNRLMSKG